VLHVFAGGKHDGEGPHGGLVPFNGTLYGTTSGGGSADDGTVFTISPTGTGERVIFSFNGSDGSGPASVLLPYKGKFYGTTNGGGDGPYPLGVVYTVSAAGKERVLYAFKGGADGDYPAGAGLVFYNGLFYGTAGGGGGTSGDGTVFTVSPSGFHSVLYTFKGSPDGNEPAAGLVFYNGAFYGTTYSGGAPCKIGGGCGTVFAVTPSGTETVLHSFNGKSDGSGPQAGLIVYNGLLYGTNSGYPSVARGTVFSISTSGELHTLHTFAPAFSSGDGAYPLAALVVVNGTLYGTTELGGADAVGTVFSISPTGKNESILHSFTGSSDGGYPSAGLLVYQNTLFGTANGQPHYLVPGTVFKLTP
jgi:uncharacterized repeat protein (TIGR03803 family)